MQEEEELSVLLGIDEELESWVDAANEFSG